MPTGLHVMGIQGMIFIFLLIDLLNTQSKRKGHSKMERGSLPFIMECLALKMRRVNIIERDKTIVQAPYLRIKGVFIKVNSKFCLLTINISRIRCVKQPLMLNTIYDTDAFHSLSSTELEV